MKNHFRPFAAFILSTCIFVCPFLKISAQVTSLKLSDYVNPAYKYRQLNLGFDLSSGINHYETTTGIGGYNNRDKVDSKNFNSNIEPEYSSSSNSAKFQGTTYAGLLISDKLGQSNGTSSYSSEKSSDGNQAAQFYFSSACRFYLKPRFYLEVNPVIRFDAGYKSTISVLKDSAGLESTNVRNIQRSAGTSDVLGLYVGIGRIENVQDAQTAAYILEDLMKLDRVRKDLNQEQVFELARLITHLRSTRFFDTRIRKIREITCIDSLMQARGWAGKADAAYFTAINDNWVYANSPDRGSGFRVYAGVAPYLNDGVEVYQAKIEIPGYNKQIIRYHDLGLQVPVLIGFQFEKPSGLKWQHSLSLSLSLSKGSAEGRQKQTQPLIEEEFVLSNENWERQEYRCVYSAGYYPSTRTNLKAGIISSLFSNEGSQKNGGLQLDGVKKLNSTNQAYIRSDYYISEKMRLVLQLVINMPYSVSHSGTTADHSVADLKMTTFHPSASLTGRLVYSIF